MSDPSQFGFAVGNPNAANISTPNAAVNAATCNQTNTVVVSAIDCSSPSCIQTCVFSTSQAPEPFQACCITHIVGGNTVGTSSGVYSGSLLLAGGDNITLSQVGQSITVIGAVASAASVNFSAGTTSNNLGSVVFSNLNGVTFGLAGSTITASVGAAGGGLTNINVSAGTTSNLLSAITFSNSNNVTFGLNASTITASVTVASTQGSVNLSAGTTSNLASAFTFSNSNNVSFGLNASTITATVTVASTQGSINISAGTTSNLGSAVTFSNSNNVSFGLNAGTVTASVNTSLTNIRVSAGTTSNLLSAITFSNLNGVTFGLDGSTITASVAPAGGAQTGISGIQVSDTTYTSGTVTFQNANGISFGSSGAQGISASYTVPVVTNSSWTVSDSATSGTVARLAFTNLNGITLSLSTGAGGSHTIVGSYTVPSTAGLLSNINVSAGTTSNLLSAITFSNSNGISFGLNASTVTASVATSLTNIRVSAGTTSNLLSAVTFSNVNGISFGLDASTITASYTVPSTAGLLSAVNVSAGTTSNNLSAVTFSNANGISFGLDASTITASVATSLTAIRVSAGTTSNLLSAVTFSNLNGISFGLDASTITASYTVPTVTNSSWTVSDNATSGTVARLAFTNLNGVTLSLSTGAGGSHTIVGSHNALTSQSNQAFSAAGGSSAFQTLDFADTNSVSFTNTNGSVGVASIKLQMFAVSNTTQSTSGTANHTALSFAGAGVASVGVTGGTVVVSVPAGGGGLTNINVSAGTTSNNLSAFTLSNSNGVSFGLDGSTVTASVVTGYLSAGMSTQGNTSGSTGMVSNRLVFVGINGITLSQSTGGASSATITISGDGATVSDFMPSWATAGRNSGTTLGQNSLYFVPFDIPCHLSASRINFYAGFSCTMSAANSTGSGRIGMSYGLYSQQTGAASGTLTRITSYGITVISETMNSNTQFVATHAFGLSDATSHSTSQVALSTSNASTYNITSINGMRVVPFPMNLTLTPGRYWLGFANSTVAAGGVGVSIVMQWTSAPGAHIAVAPFGTASAATNASFPRELQGIGTYSATSADFPASIAFTTDHIRAAITQSFVIFDIKGWPTSTNFI